MAPAPLSDLATLYGCLSRIRRRQLLFVALLMPVTAVAEMAMIAAIIPFLALLGGSPGNNLLLTVQWLLDGLSPNPLVAAGLLFGLTVVVTAALRLALSWLSQQFAFGSGHELVVAIQRRLLHQPYAFHLSHHSSQLLTSLDKVDFLVFSLALQGIQAVSAMLISLFVIGALLWIDPLSAGLAAILVGGLYGLVLISARRRLSGHADVIQAAYQERLKEAQESLGGIRDIILDQSQELRVDRFEAIDARFMAARAQSAFLVAAPRFLVEALGLMMIALLAMAVAGRAGGLVAALPILGALALGAQRLLPLTSQIYSGWANLTASRPIIRDLAELANLPLEEDGQGAAQLAFTQAIKLDAVGFHYADRSRPALQGISITIPKGARVAVIGKTGAGKSTLADVLMGLIQPTEGRIEIDGVAIKEGAVKAWRRSVAHVPQAIFLADDSIIANIALPIDGSPPDLVKVRQAAATTQLLEFVDSLPDGFETRVGERGVRLSGGQRQRLAIARAIYKDAPLLVLDEATSALDDETEAAFLKTLDALDAEGKTIVIIAHRRSTIAGCDMIIRLENGRLAEVVKPPAPKTAFAR
jgi:ATP-binding cassette subfamily B protein